MLGASGEKTILKCLIARGYGFYFIGYSSDKLEFKLLRLNAQDTSEREINGYLNAFAELL